MSEEKIRKVTATKRTVGGGGGNRKKKKKKKKKKKRKGGGGGGNLKHKRLKEQDKHNFVDIRQGRSLTKCSHTPATIYLCELTIITI